MTKADTVPITDATKRQAEEIDKHALVVVPAIDINSNDTIVAVALHRRLKLHLDSVDDGRNREHNYDDQNAAKTHHRC